MNSVYQVVFPDISRRPSHPLRATVDVTLSSSSLKADYHVERESSTLKQINVVFHSPCLLFLFEVFKCSIW
jgi:hypothetical protein